MKASRHLQRRSLTKACRSRNTPRVASAILSFFGIHLGGWIGYLVAGFIGAVLLIWIVRAVQGTRRPV